MLKKPYLMIPGPTPVPDRVLQAMHRPVINHRGPEYEAMFRDVCCKLQQVFKTKNEVLTFPAAGTGAMEAAVVNILSPGDKVLVVSIGVFGDRFAEIAGRYGAKVEKLDFPWGEAAAPAVLADRLNKDKHKEIKAVFITHNETSTGVTNDIKELMAACGDHPALRVVDAVSSLGAINLETDAWGVDVVVTGAQKALMLPPGLAFMAMSERAWAANKASTMPRFYWDAQSVRKSLAKGQNPYTPPVSLIFGLQESLNLLLEEGLENIFARHRLLAVMVRAGLKALGLELLAADSVASSVVTAVKAPPGIDPKQIRKIMRERYGITLAGGHKHLEKEIFRIGHLGYVVPTDILVTLAALEMTLAELKFDVVLGSGVSAAQKILLAEV